MATQEGVLRVWNDARSAPPRHACACRAHRGRGVPHADCDERCPSGVPVTPDRGGVVVAWGSNDWGQTTLPTSLNGETVTAVSAGGDALPRADRRRQGHRLGRQARLVGGRGGPGQPGRQDRHRDRGRRLPLAGADLGRHRHRLGVRRRRGGQRPGQSGREDRHRDRRRVGPLDGADLRGHHHQLGVRWVRPARRPAQPGRQDRHRDRRRRTALGCAHRRWRHGLGVQQRRSAEHPGQPDRQDRHRDRRRHLPLAGTRQRRHLRRVGRQRGGTGHDPAPAWPGGPSPRSPVAVTTPWR